MIEVKILYTTDLHGSDTYYNVIKQKAVKHRIDMVINGADTQTMEMERYGHDTELMMINAFTPEGEKNKYIQISKLPDYLIKPFNKWMQAQAVTDPPEKKYNNSLQAHSFENSCSAEGI